MIYVILFSLIGIILGLIAGILPGIHPNQFFVLVVSFLPFLSQFPTEATLALIINIMVSNILLNYIPAIFFSVPDPETIINILPGHRMVLEGKGMEALFISLAGAFFTLVGCVITLPVLLWFIPILHEFVYPYLHFLLIALAAWMLIMEKTWRNRLLSLFLYLVSGIWGILCLNSTIISSEWALFPTLTGMFGIAGLLMSMKEGIKIPKQVVSKNIDTGNIPKIVISGLIAGLLIGVLPGAGESQAGVLVSEFTGLGQNEFLGSLAGINMGNAFFALVSLYSFGKVRSGAAAAINDIIPEFGMNHLVFSVGLILLSAGLSVLVTWVIGKRSLKFLERIDYRLASQIILGFTVVMVLWFTGIVGVFIMAISTCLGLLPVLWGIKRTSNMGFLMVSTTIYFAGLTWVINGVLF
jgi:putative membrane protein